MADGYGITRDAIPGRSADSQRRSDLALMVLERHQKMYEVRGNFNTLWQSVAQRVMPNYADFTTRWAEGQRRTNLVFDSTAPIALGHGCAALESMLCPSSRRWHGLRPADKRLRGNIQIMQYCDALTDALFAARYAPSANFQSQIEESFRQILSFGNGPLLVDDVVGYGLRYRCLHLAFTYGMENAAGVIDTIHREYELTAKAACDAEYRDLFDKGSLPEQIRNDAESNPTKTYTFIQAIWPDEDNLTRQPGTHFKSCTVNKETKTLLREAKYHTQPILMARYQVNPRETYGRGPGVDVLPEILALNEMEKSDIRVTQRISDPPLLAAAEDSLPPFDLRSNSVNYGYVNPETGKPLVLPLAGGGDLRALKDKTKEKRDVVNRAFLNDIFSVLIEQPNMTATEVLQRAQEKGYLLAPIVGRIQSELISPMIQREIDILQRAGRLPDPPDVLRKLGGLDYEIVYTSMVQQMQKQADALTIAQVFQQTAPLIQADPSVLGVVNMQRTFRRLVEANSAPADMLNTEDEQAQKDQAQVQQQQLTNLAQIAGPASQAIKNLSDANRGGTSATPGNTLQ